jgi:uncharacterized protein involved in exopolysaccharide biosynthesis
MTLLIRQAIDLNFKYLVAATRRGIMPAAAAFTLTVLAAAVAARLTDPLYLAEGKLLFKPDRAATLTGVASPEEGGPLQSIGYGTQINSEIQVITSKPLIQATINKLQLKDEEGETLKIEDMLKNLQVKVLFQTDVLSFTYLDKDPLIAANIINALMELYRTEKLSSTQVDTASAADFLDRQIPITAEQVKQAENQLRIFREQNSVVNLPEEQGILVAALNDFRQEKDKIRTELSSLYAVQANLRNELGLTVSDAIKTDTLSQSQHIQDALAELNEVRRELVIQRVDFTEESPIIQRLLAQKSSLESFLNESVSAFGGGPVQESLLQSGNRTITVQADKESSLQASSIRDLLMEEYVANQLKITSLEGGIKAADANAQEYQERVNIFPKLEQRQRDLIRTLETAQATYQELLDRRQEIGVRENQSNDFIRIIEPAIPPQEPSSTATKKILAMGIIAGFALGLIIIVVIDFVVIDVKGFNKIYNPDAHQIPAGPQ